MSLHLSIRSTNSNYGNNLQALILAEYVNPLPEPVEWAKSVVSQGMIQVGFLAAALTGVLTLILVIKAFSKG